MSLRWNTKGKYVAPHECKQGIQAFITKQRRLTGGREDVPKTYTSLLDMSDLWLGQVCTACFDTGSVGSHPCPCFRFDRMLDIYNVLYPQLDVGEAPKV